MNATPQVPNKKLSRRLKKKPFNPFTILLLIIIAATGIQIGNKWFSPEKENNFLKKQLEPYEEAE